MSRVRLRLTVTLTTLAVTAVLGGALAPAASASSGPDTLLPSLVSTTNGAAPGVLAAVRFLGRKL